MTTSQSDKVARPADWQDPPAPAGTVCSRCKSTLQPEYLKPVFWEGRPIGGTGIWRRAKRCPTCEQAAEQEDQANARKKRVEEFISLAGFAPRHARMTVASFEPPIVGMGQKALDAGRQGDNLFIYSETKGVGKTHLAAALLRDFIERTASVGYFKIVPELCLELRSSSRSGQDIALIDTITAADALVLDDLGTERKTPLQMESLYIIIDRWHRNEKKNLTITSNQSLESISKNIDDRIASRISGMCRIFEFSGTDQRALRERGR